MGCPYSKKDKDFGLCKSESFTLSAYPSEELVYSYVSQAHHASTNLQKVHPDPDLEALPGAIALTRDEGHAEVELHTDRVEFVYQADPGRDRGL